MRLVVTGATGNVGTSLLSLLAAEPAVSAIVGVARRRPGWENLKTSWVQADVRHDDLDAVFAGADAVVHLAWLIQPSRELELIREVNVDGSRRVFEAAARAGVSTLVHASSIGAYSKGPKDATVSEEWPTQGIPTSFYSRHKVEAERILDRVEREHPDLRVVRLRPALIFKREAASGIRRLFVGPLLPSPLVRSQLVAGVPSHPRLRVQAVHSLDVADAYRRAVITPAARGAYNVAAEPVLDGPEVARLLGARPVPVNAGVLRAATVAAYKLRLHPTPAGWLDLALGVPLMDSTRARVELGWEPRHSASDALLELLDGLRESAGFPTPPLDRGTSGPLRVRELLTGVGRRT
jgi:UDP-glucose 4-epimerase